jgi:hypothetical protein
MVEGARGLSSQKSGFCDQSYTEDAGLSIRAETEGEQGVCLALLCSRDFRHSLTIRQRARAFHLQIAKSTAREKSREVSLLS